jgi:outer membrane protein TolC
LSQDNLKSEINTEYEQSLANYKSSLAEYNATLDNVKIAEEVNNVVKLQYNQGIKAYLEVITSETDLSTAQINHLNATLQVLSAKLDVQKALGKIPTN